MCKMIFIGVTESLSVVPWNDSEPSFYLEHPKEKETAILNKFRNPFVYFVGTHRGCSCDFISLHEDDSDDFF